MPADTSKRTKDARRDPLPRRDIFRPFRRLRGVTLCFSAFCATTPSSHCAKLEAASAAASASAHAPPARPVSASRAATCSWMTGMSLRTRVFRQPPRKGGGQIITARAAERA